MAREYLYYYYIYIYVIYTYIRGTMYWIYSYVLYTSIIYGVFACRFTEGFIIREFVIFQFLWVPRDGKKPSNASRGTYTAIRRTDVPQLSPTPTVLSSSSRLRARLNLFVRDRGRVAGGEIFFSVFRCFDYIIISVKTYFSPISGNSV